MDKTTVIGLVGAWVIFFIALLFGGVNLGIYIDIPSVFIVFGGSAMIIVGQFEAKDLKRLGSALSVAFKENQVEPMPELIDKIVYYATEMKKHGVMSVEEKVLMEKNPFFKEAFSLIIDGTKPELIQSLLETKMEHMEKRHVVIHNMLSSLGGTAGSMGMIGTLVGLVAMLANLSDPSSVGPAMAVALITTLYGALIGNLISGIFESKLAQKHSVEATACDVIIMGAVMISSDESIGNIKMSLNSVIVLEDK